MTPQALQQRFGGGLSRREQGLLVGACLLVGLLCGQMFRRGGVHERGLNDAVFRTWITSRNAHLNARNMGAASSRLLMVVFDEAAKDRYGYPLPRALYYQVVRRLVEAGCDTIAISVNFENKSPDDLSDRSLTATLQDPHVVVPYRFDALDGQLSKVFPHAPLIESLSAQDLESRLGFSAVPGEDGDVRAVWLKVTQAGHPPFYAFPVVALAQNQQISPEQLLSRVKTRTHRCSVDSVPVEAVEAWVNIPGPWGGSHTSLLPEITISELLDTPPRQLKSKLSGRSLAVLGETAPLPGVRGFASGSGDGRKSTLAGRFYGADIQACTILNLMLNNFLMRADPVREMAYVVGLSGWIGLLASLLNLRWFLAGSVVSGAGWLLASQQALAVGGVLLAVFGPLVSLGLSVVVSSLLKLHFIRLSRRKRILDLVREVCPTADLQVLESRAVTILLADLRDYRYLLERGDPIAGLSAMHVYFEAVRRVLAYFGGVVVDYQDNSQVVVFGMVAKSRKAHALMACQAAAALVSEAERLNLRGLGLPLARIGLSTGESSGLGEAVTKASSLPQLARQLSCEVLLTESTWVAADGTIQAIPLQQAGADVRKLSVEKTLLSLESEGRMPWEPIEGALDPSQLKEGEAHNHYLLQRLLGQGGMGRVFLAQDTRLLRSVAIKVVLGYMDEVHCRRFLKEAQAVARVQHPGIVAIYEAGVKPFPYLVMEFASGHPLDQVLLEKLPIPETVALIGQILDALCVVHSNGILHRDLKPANIMVCPDGHAKLMDFGLARFTEDESRITRPGEIWGTPEYMAPEQVEPEFGEVDAVSDLFAVASILYEALTGMRAVKKGTVSMIIYDLIYRDPDPPHLVNPEVSEELSQVCMKGLQKEKAQRYQTAREFAQALRSVPG